MEPQAPGKLNKYVKSLLGNIHTCKSCVYISLLTNKTLVSFPYLWKSFLTVVITLYCKLITEIWKEGVEHSSQTYLENKTSINVIPKLSLNRDQILGSTSMYRINCSWTHSQLFTYISGALDSLFTTVQQVIQTK